MLEHEADMALAHVLVGGIDAIDENAAAVGALEPRDDPEQRRLAATRRPEKGDELSARQVEAHVTQGLERTKRLGNMRDGNTHGASSRVRDALSTRRPT